MDHRGGFRVGGAATLATSLSRMWRPHTLSLGRGWFMIYIVVSFKYRNFIIKSELIIIQGCVVVHLKGVAILYLRQKKQFAVIHKIRFANYWKMPSYGKKILKIQLFSHFVNFWCFFSLNSGIFQYFAKRFIISD